MEEMYSSRLRKANKSDLAELFKLAEQPEVISFAGGFPDPRWFLDEVEEVSRDILRHKRDIALQYGPVPGLTIVREFIAHRMTEQGMPVDIRNILLTSGSLQGLDLICRVFLDPGDTVIVEAPTYLGAISTFESYEVNIVSISCDNQGLMVDELEKYLDNAYVKPKLIYVIPTFQNPSGRVLSLERRKRLIDLCSKYNIPLIEDNAYGELRFSGEDLPTLMALDNTGMVIYLGTFSKIFSPGIRLGWVAASPDIIEKLVLFKQITDQSSSSLSQLLAYEAHKRGLIDMQIKITKEGLKLKRDLTINALKKYFGSTAEWTVSEGGFYTWVQIHKDINTFELLRAAVEDYKVAYVAGPSFFPDGRGQNCIRICYSMVKEDRIEEGIKRLAEIFLGR